MVNFDSAIIVGLVFGIPVVLYVLGSIILNRSQKQTKGFIRISESEFEIKNVLVEGKKLRTEVNGQKRTWSVESNPKMLKTKVGLVPFYYCEVGKATTSEFDKTKTSTLTEKELSEIENQSILSTLLKADVLGAENIIMLMGALGGGIAIGFVIKDMGLMGGG